MMMITEVADHKRRMHDGFVLSRSPSEEKRLKTGDGGRAGGAHVPTKEKKDRVGERVAKLQQLVSPFGKTDTASVLSEATEYIKFLHDQLQVLSAPYLRTIVTAEMEGGDYCSLRSRGLCLMPVASTFKIAQSNGADLWAPVNSSRNP